MKKECDVCGGKADPEHLPDEPQPPQRSDETGKTISGYNPNTDNLCTECYQDKYWIKGEDY